MSQSQRKIAAQFDLDETLKSFERLYVDAALRFTRGNVTHAAKLLGINRTTLISRMGKESTNVAELETGCRTGLLTGPERSRFCAADATRTTCNRADDAQRTSRETGGHHG